MSALGQKQTFAPQQGMSALPAKSGHRCYRETERDRQPRPNRGIKLLTASGCDLMAMRAAALLNFSKRTNRHGLLPTSNTKRLNDPAGSILSPDTSRSSP